MLLISSLRLCCLSTVFVVPSPWVRRWVAEARPSMRLPQRLPSANTPMPRYACPRRLGTQRHNYTEHAVNTPLGAQPSPAPRAPLFAASATLLLCGNLPLPFDKYIQTPTCPAWMRVLRDTAAIKGAGGTRAPQTGAGGAAPGAPEPDAPAPAPAPASACCCSRRRCRSSLLAASAAASLPRLRASPSESGSAATASTAGQAVVSSFWNVAYPIEMFLQVGLWWVGGGITWCWGMHYSHTVVPGKA